MAMETEDYVSNLNALKEMILDEEKFITYISLSKDLCIHINSSKSLLKVFLESIRQENPKQQLSVNYLISGLIDDNKAKVSVCPEDELDNLKKNFKIIFFQHIYSICKGKSNIDPAAYVSVNKYDDFHLCSGIIKNTHCNKRSFEEINSLKSNSQEIKVEKRPILSQKKNLKEQVPKAVNGNNVDTKVKMELNHKEIKKEVISPQKENINKQIGSKPAAQKGIAGFFNKQNGSNKKKETKPPENLQPILKEEQNVVVEKMETDEVVVESKVKEEVKEKEVNGNNKVLNHIKKKSKVDKKRKRVLHVSDSESEDENDPFVEQATIHEKSHESDDEIPPTPAANNLKITTGIVNPRKKRKVVDKTYMSDDGYIITKREEVYESCSDNENDDEKKLEKQKPKEEKIEISPKTKTSGTKTTKKVSPTQKGKQPTLMNFFKKK